MKTVHLHGSLGARFGREYRLDITTPAEAVRALCVQLPGFEEAIRAGNWHVVRGPLAARDEVSEEALTLSLGQQEEVHLIPAISGANNGWVNTIVGAVLIVVGAMTSWAGGAGLIGAGIGMMLGGIIQLTTKIPGAEEVKSADEKASYLFNGPTNQSSQGVGVPRGYGRLKVGSIVVSAGLFSEETA